MSERPNPAGMAISVATRREEARISEASCFLVWMNFSAMAGITETPMGMMSADGRLNMVRVMPE